MKLRFGSPLVFVFSVFLIGCGEQEEDIKRVAVHGTVAISGTPLETGSISLLPAEGNEAPAANAMISQGQYAFDSSNGPVAGAYRVIVMRPADAPAAGAKKFHDGSAPPPTPAKEWETAVEIPDASDFVHNIDLK